MNVIDPDALLTRPVTELPGIARRRAAMLHKLGIQTWYDLLTWFPRDYENWQELVTLADLEDGQTSVFQAVVTKKPLVSRQGRRSLVRTILRDQGYALQAVWFNQPWMADRLSVGTAYIFRGRVRRRGSQFSVQNPEFEPAETETEASVRPVYPLTSGISQAMMRQLIHQVLDHLQERLPEPIPSEIRALYKLCSVNFAYHRIHHPADPEEAAVCRQRLAFEELFLMQAGLYLLRHSDTDQRQAPAIVLSASQTGQIEEQIRQLPFSLTKAQKKVLQSVWRDLARPQPMNRLVQGDVGSGKTVVAALAMLRCALAGHQAVLMAPTTVLAIQHQQTLSRLLQSSGEPVGLLTGATPAAERRQILARLANGEMKLLVGTHALIEDRVVFHQLALAVTDEQHRFGVRQRIQLAHGDDARLQPHVLVMSATPIPRTLALMVYGDLDLSVIDEQPAGRLPIQTYTAAEKDRSRLDDLIRRTVTQGQQVYVVCPMIEDGTASDLSSVESVYERLASRVMPDLAVGLLHGQLKTAAKDQVMQDFQQGIIQVLVSTTVIEVGVDNPNATLMLIENAERFGLAQLHQLRGRIGRGDQASICVLVSESRDDLARQRLRTLCHTTDGFEIAEQDLQLRGPGDFFGTRQHGLPPLRLANLYTDHELIAAARDSVRRLTDKDPLLQQPQHRIIRQTLRARYGDVFAAIGI